MIKEQGTVKRGVYLSDEAWAVIIRKLQFIGHAMTEPDANRENWDEALEYAAQIETQLASPSSWISGAKEQG